jgi:ElaB/YqjD/DUF883 family membrane-anchored ribosome-binding protein
MTTSEDEVAALRDDIARTRAELGETVEALAAKADVKARAHEKVEETKARVATMAAEAKEKAREKAEHAAETGRELVQELRTEPAVPARRAVYRVRTSVQEHPRQWAAAGAALVAFVLLVARRRTMRARRAARDWRV